MTDAVSPLDHHPDHMNRWCVHCGNLTFDPTRCPGWTAHRTRATFHAEGWEHGEWTGTVSSQETLAAAVVEWEHKRRRFPDLPQRLMTAITLYFPVADPAGPGEEIQQLLDGTTNTAALLSRAFGQERDRALAAEARVRELEELLGILGRLRPDGEPRECTGYQVVGDWGVDYAESADDARANVRRSLAKYPHCRARAEQRTYITWDDDTEFIGPWRPLDPEGDEA